MLGLIMFCLVCGALIFAMDSNSKAKMYKRALEEKIREEKDRKEKEAIKRKREAAGLKEDEEELKDEKTAATADLKNRSYSFKYSALLKEEDKLNASSKESSTDKDLEEASAKVIDSANNEPLKVTEKLDEAQAETVKPDIPKPIIQKPRLKFKMPDKNFYNILLMTLGVVFVLLAGIIFATTNWHTMSGVTKLLCILFVVVSVYALSFFAEKKFKLSFISRSLYILASFLLFMAVIAIAYFKLMGRYLSLSEDTRYLTFFVASIFTEISLLLALKKFNRRWYTDICLYGISVCICFLVMAFNMPLAFTITYLAVYAILCVIVDLYIEKSKTDLISKELKTDISAFAQTNLLAVSIMVMFFFRRDLHQGIVTIVLSIVHLYLGDKRENKINSAGFVVFLALAVYRIAYGNFEHSILYMLCMLLSIFTSVNMMGTFRQNTRTYANIASAVSCVAIIISVCYYFVVDGGQAEFASLLSLTLVWIYILINDIKYRKAKISILNILAFMFLLNYAIVYFNISPYALHSLINVVIFSIVVIVKNRFKLDHKVWLAALVNMSFFTVFAFWDYYTNLTYEISDAYTIICILLSIFVYYVLSKENYIFGIFVPALWAALVHILVYYTNINPSLDISFEWALFIYFLLACAYKLMRKRDCDIGLGFWMNVFAIIYSVGHLSDFNIPAPYFVLAGLYLLAHLVMRKEKKDPAYHIVMLLNLILGIFISLYFAKVDKIIIELILAATTLMISALYKYVLKEDMVSDVADIVSLILGVIAIWGYITVAFPESFAKALLYFILITAFCIVYNIKAYIEKKYRQILINSSVFWFLLMTKFMLEMSLQREYLTIAAVTILNLVSIAFLRYKTPIIKEDKDTLAGCDWWSITWGVHIAAMLTGLSVDLYRPTYIRSIYILLLALYCLQYITVKKYKSMSQLCSTVCFVAFIWLQDFVTIPSVYDFEVKVFSLLLIPLAFKGMVNNKEYRIINVSARAAVLLMLTWAAVQGGLLEDSIIVLVFALILLVYTSIRKHRKEFLIAFSFAITIAVFMSRTFWTRVSWFAYLFAAGLLLIGLAVYNEMRRKKQEVKGEGSEAGNKSKDDAVENAEVADNTDTAANNNISDNVNAVDNTDTAANADEAGNAGAADDSDAANAVKDVGTADNADKVDNADIADNADTTNNEN